jgi:PPOX class probable F420-dependent enzyme
VRLGEEEARARFGSVPVVRLGTADAGGRPHLVVVTFAVEGDTVFTAVDQKPKSGTNLKRLRNVGENPRVTMLADEYSDDWDALWWVRADGRAVVLADPQQMAEPLRLLAERYWQYREAPPTGPVLAVTVERWSGWAAAGSLFGSLFLLGPPAAVQLNELLPLLRSQVFRLQAPGEPDDLPHLGQVLGAVRAARQVRLEAPPGPPR